METIIIDQHMSLRLVSFYLTWHAGWTDTQRIIYQLSGYFFDGSHKRCKGFKTITVAFYHPLVRKMVKILTIDVKSETSESFVVMWELLNECLQKLTKNKNYKFNPTGWMADENGANWNGMEKVLERTHFTESYHVNSTFYKLETPIETKS